MSNEKVETAALEGYDGPFFPESLGEMHQMMYGGDSSNFNGQSLAEVTKRQGLECAVERLTTSDEYCWFWCLIITTGNATVVIALPWAQDWDKSDDTRSDRHSAVYTYGSVSEESLDGFIRGFVEASQPLAA